MLFGSRSLRLIEKSVSFSGLKNLGHQWTSESMRLLKQTIHAFTFTDNLIDSDPFLKRPIKMGPKIHVKTANGGIFSLGKTA